MDALHSISTQPISVFGGPVAGGEMTEGTNRPGGRFALPSGLSQGRDSGNVDRLGLSPEAETQLRELKQRDAEVRAHERAHLSAGGQYVNGGPHYTYQKGPDGKQYAIGGHVDIDVSPVSGDPEATRKKAEQVRRAATAPGQPSSQDRQVAAEAAAMSAEAVQNERGEKRLETEGMDPTAPHVVTAEIVDTQDTPRNRAQAHAAQAYADMSMRGVMPVSLAPGSFVATSITV